MKKKRVLYAEDELSNRKLLQIKLERNGIECDVAENGRQAIQMFKEKKYDLVILDYYMPEMDGVETASVIRGLSPDIPVFAVTSDDEKKTILHEAGFIEVIIKPLHGKHIIDLVKTYLN